MSDIEATVGHIGLAARQRAEMALADGDLPSAKLELEQAIREIQDIENALVDGQPTGYVSRRPDPLAQIGADVPASPQGASLVKFAVKIGVGVLMREIDAIEKEPEEWLKLPSGGSWRYMIG